MKMPVPSSAALVTKAQRSNVQTGAREFTAAAWRRTLATPPWLGYAAGAAPAGPKSRFPQNANEAPFFVTDDSAARRARCKAGEKRPSRCELHASTAFQQRCLQVAILRMSGGDVTLRTGCCKTAAVCSSGFARKSQFCYVLDLRAICS